MSYTANVFNVMIASPGDLSSERAIIREVVHEWNAIHSMKRAIVLLPVGWETHTTPEMGEHPQKIINKQVLCKCDLLVGVFWTRIGTRTTDYLSGTVEEIEEHIKTGKPVMLYFSEQPVVYNSVDHDQYNQLISFKESCKSRGLYESYDNLTEFKDKFNRQLQIKVNDHQLFQIVAPANANDHVIDGGYFDSNASIPNLSREAKILLKEASRDRSGFLMRVGRLGGIFIQTNGKNFTESSERRDIAKWEAAFEQLILEGCIVDKGRRGEVFFITDLGYKIADMIEL